MPMFMDAHTIEGGVSVSDVAAAHEADLATQGQYGVRYERYWVDEAAGKIFCLVEAPDAETPGAPGPAPPPPRGGPPRGPPRRRSRTGAPR